MHRGDFDTSAVIYGKFTTYRPSTGAAYTLAGTPALSVYKDNSTTQSTAGVTLTADFDSVTGLNHFAIDTSADGTFYSAGSFFDIVITTGTVDGVSVVGAVVASFTIRKDSSLKPTTAARTLDVSAGGEAGIDWANIGSPTTAVDLSGTNIKTNQKVDVETIKTQTVTCAAGVTVLASVGTAATSTAQTGDSYALANGASGFVAIKGQTAAIETDTQDIQSRIPAALVSGRIDASVGAMAANVLTATAIAADAITDAKVASDVTIASVTGAVGSVTGAVGSVTGNVGGNVTGSVGSVTGLTNSTIADQVWDEVLSGHAGVGSTGAALAAAGGSGDPWATALPGAYGAGTAGQIVGDYLDAAISSVSGLDAAGVRAALGLASANLDTQLGAIDTVVDAILVDTAEIGAAGAGLTALASAANLATVAGYLDTEIAAIKAKTDNLPASPAAVGSAMTLSAAAYEAAADALLNRNVSGGSNTGRTVKQCYHFIRNKWVAAAGTLTVYDTDDTTTSWTSALTGTAGADPITATDPS